MAQSKIPEIMIFPRTRKQWLKTISVIIIFGIIAQSIISTVKLSLGVQSEHPWYELLLVSVLYSACIIFSQMISGELLGRFVPLDTKLKMSVHIVAQSFSGILGFMAAQKVEYFIYGYCFVSAQIIVVVISVSFVLTLIGNTAYYLSFFYRIAQTAEKSATESELKALRAQINPHFLFNTLNSIAALIRVNPDEAEEVTEELAELFRYSLQASKTPLVRFSNEIHSVHLYVNIEKARFRDRLQVYFHIADTVDTALVPSLILQPLVENSVKYGANVVEGEFTIEIEALERNGTMYVTVRDSGPGFDQTQIEQYFVKGTGLSNVRDRLALLFPRQSDVVIARDSVTLIFPKKDFNESIQSHHKDIHSYRKFL